MKLAPALLVAVTVASSALAQAPAPPAPAPFAPYVRQLGLEHFPGGEAAFSDSIGPSAVLPTGAVVVAGTTAGSLGEPFAGGFTGDIFVARFDHRGRLQWVSQVGAITGPTIPALNGNASGPGGDASGNDVVSGIAVGSDGSIYVSGSTDGSLGETNGWGSIPGGWDVFVAKFDAQGSLQWLRQIGAETAPTIVPPPGATQWGDATGYELSSALVLGADGELYVSGIADGNLGENYGGDVSDFFFARFDPAGHLQWLRQAGEVSDGLFGYDAADWDDAGGLALHPSGMLVLAGTRLVVWDYDADQFPVLLACDGLGQPITSWMLPGSGEEAAYGVAIDPNSGHVYVTGYTRADLADQNLGGTDFFVAKLDASFGLQWISQVGVRAAATLGLLDGSEIEVAGSLQIDPSGNVIVGGRTTGSLVEPNPGLGDSYDVITAKFRGSDGVPLWITQIGQVTASLHGLDASGSDGGGDLVLGPRGTIVVSGWTDGSLGETKAGQGDGFLIRLNPDGGLD